MTPVNTLILLLEDFQALKPIEQLGAVTGFIGALGGSVFWAWRKGRRYVAQLIETNGKLKQKLKDSATRTGEIQRRIEEHRHTVALLQAQEPAAMLAQAAADTAHAREILTELFDQLAPTLATCCREMAEVELALTLDAEDQPHLQRAKRLAQAAVLLAPEWGGSLRDLFAEIDAIRAVWEEDGALPTANMLWNAAFDYVGGSDLDLGIPLMRRVHETGWRRYSEGHYAVAAVLLRRATLLAHRNFGAQHPETLTTCNNLAVALSAQGRYADAEVIEREVLELQEEALGPDHPDVANSLNSLASLYRAQGKYDLAEPLHQRALSIREKALGPDHPDVANSLNNLAGLYRAQGKYDLAEPLHQRALSRRVTAATWA